MSWLNLEGKTAIVTGGASGIGKSIAQGFLDHGANVVICDLNHEQPIFARDAESGDFFYIVMDVTKGEDILRMVKQVKERFGKMDILVNNVGINLPCLLVDPHNPYGEHEINEQVYDRMMNVNVKSVYLMSQAISREFIANGRGVIINISSESGMEGSEGQSIYAATKNAINAFTRSWAKELGKYHIRVVGVAPGILEPTGLRTLQYEQSLAYTRGITVEILRQRYNRTMVTPLGRVGRVKEIADTVIFLASDRASYIHGVTYNVAGGKTRG